MKNSKIFSKLILVFLSLFFVSCAMQDDQPKIRIVDMNGNAKPVVTRMPDLNAQAMVSQGMVVDRRGMNQDRKSSVTQNTLPAKNDFGTASSQAIQQTLQTQPAPEVSQIPTTNSSVPIVVAGTVPEEKNEAIEYNLSDSQTKAEAEERNPIVKTLVKTPGKKTVKKIAVKKPAKEVAVAAQATGGKKFFVQVGSFSNQGNADILLGKMKKFHSGKVEVVEGEKAVYRVWLGPFPNRIKANAMVKKVTTSGHEAILVKGQ